MPVNFCVRFTIFPSNKINIENRQYHILLFCLLFKNCIKKTATTKKKNPKSESVCINKNVGQNDQSCTFCDCSRNMIVITAGIYLRSGCTSFLPEVSWSANRRGQYTRYKKKHMSKFASFAAAARQDCRRQNAKFKMILYLILYSLLTFA